MNIPSNIEEIIEEVVETGEPWTIELEHKPVAVILEWTEYQALLAATR